MITQGPCVEGCVCEGLGPAWTDSCTDPHCGAMSQGHADGFIHKDAEPDALCQVLDIQRQARASTRLRTSWP